MRIVIDMQAAQLECQGSGSGQDFTGFAKAIARNGDGHRIILALNGLMHESVEPIRAIFDGLVSQDDIRVWYAPGPLKAEDPRNDVRREVAEILREGFLASLEPSVIHLGTVFDGYSQDVVTSIGRLDRLSVVSVFAGDCPRRDTDAGTRYASFIERQAGFLKQASVEIRWPGFSAEGPATAGGGADRSNSEAASEDAAAGRAIMEFQRVVKERGLSQTLVPPSRRPKLALVSPLPPERTGIADYSAELVPVLAQYYDIDVVTGQDNVTVPWVGEHGEVRSVEWFMEHGHEYERVLYHFGNSPFHAHMFDLMERIPGVVVLHDFYLGGAQWPREALLGQSGAFARGLYESHGYPAVQARFGESELADVVREFPANFEVFRNSMGVVVHSDYARRLARAWYGSEIADMCTVIPLLRVGGASAARGESRCELGISEDQFLVCSFGFQGPSKCTHELLDAWLGSSLAHDPRCMLVLVGNVPSSEYGREIRRRIGASRGVFITGYADAATYRHYLGAADMAVQLRQDSRGETSAAALDCMKHGLPLVVNANGAMAELPENAVRQLRDQFTIEELARTLEQLWRDPETRRLLGGRAQKHVETHHSPLLCARRYMEALETSYSHAPAAWASGVIEEVGRREPAGRDSATLRKLARSIAANHPWPRPARRLFLDVTATRLNDIRTGIQRVTRALALAFLNAPPEGWRVEPVYVTNEGGAWHHRAAADYTLKLLGCPGGALAEEPLVPQAGDVLVILDLATGHITESARAGLFSRYRASGARVYSIVYDLLPVQMPEVFPAGTPEAHRGWLEAISTFDGALGISKAVADDLRRWQGAEGFTHNGRRPYVIDWFPLGADIEGSAPSRGLPEGAQKILHDLGQRPTFLMVGTIEPRKAYPEALEAFSRLWDEGIDINLVIVGNEGWTSLENHQRRNIPETVSRLDRHVERGERLFWLSSVSDEYLDQIYKHSTCLVAASYGEGFGLPLVEAAERGLPVICRDIPVFREVAGDAATYFGGASSGPLEEVVKVWLSRRTTEAEGPVPMNSVRTWADSVGAIVSCLQMNHECQDHPETTFAFTDGDGVSA